MIRMQIVAALALTLTIGCAEPIEESAPIATATSMTADSDKSNDDDATGDDDEPSLQEVIEQVRSLPTPEELDREVKEALSKRDQKETGPLEPQPTPAETEDESEPKTD